MHTVRRDFRTVRGRRGSGTRRIRRGGVGLLAALAFAALALADSGTAAEKDTLRVCADPNNLPFSNRAGEGLENRLADLLAEALGLRVEYTWWAQRRGFLRNTLNAGRCDVVMGLPVDVERALTTEPYYRSTYVMVYPAGAGYAPRALDDPVLRRLRIGVHLIGDDGVNPPPVHELSERGITDNVVGYPIYGDYREPNPPARLIEAAATGEVDLAIAWGPVGAYFAARQDRPMRVVPLQGDRLPFAFSIAVGVRKNDTPFRDRLQAALDRHRREVQELLTAYRIPQVGQAALAEKRE